MEFILQTAILRKFHVAKKYEERGVNANSGSIGFEEQS
jgi:hypothetical protein